MDEKILGGLAAMISLFVSGAVFGRLHPTDPGGGRLTGDRVMCGLIAMPLISIAVAKAFPASSIGWAIAAPLPLMFYLLLLAGADVDAGGKVKSQTIAGNFVRLMLISVLGLYALLAIVALVRVR